MPKVAPTILKHSEVIACCRALQLSENAQQLTDIFDQFIQGLGLNTFILVEVTDPDIYPGPNLLIGTIPKNYLKKYWQGGNIFHDPMTRQIIHANIPVRFCDIAKSPDPTRDEQKTMDMRAKQGIIDGYSFPLKGRLNRFAMMGVHGDVSGFIDCDVMLLEMLCIEFYRQATQLFPLPANLQQAEHGVLTKRERECLSWVAKGKTNWDVSQILMITERTVQYHIENAREKLGAESRLHAVILAARHLEIVL
ncbi:MAG: hypothetical protein COA47_04665 [Robiginitomaculum sp.]|nr:MAG: hypothetical protein COA47_04665 [Robiginitomaculum sp.]